MNHEKLGKILQRYLDLLDLRKKRSRNKKGNFGSGYNSKIRLIAFYNKNGEWPSKRSPYVLDKQLAVRLENYVSKASKMYDPVLRLIVLATGRKPSFKRKHNVQLFKQEILQFVETHNRAPTTHAINELVPGEAKLRQKLDYYTKNRNDMGLMGKVYAIDKCHRSGIPARFRSIINEALDVEKPLIRLVKENQTKEQNNE